MAGRLTISTLNNDTGVLATQNGMTGIAKAWCNFNGEGTVVIRDSFNVSSITDNGTGLYTVNFTTALPNINYAVSTGISPRYAAGSAFANLFSNSATTEVTPTTTAFTLRCGATDSGVNADLKYVCVSVFSS